MKLARTVHTDAGVFYGDAAELVPDVAAVDGPGGAKCLLFVDAGGEEAHAYFFSEDQCRELARTIHGLQVARVLPA